MHALTLRYKQKRGVCKEPAARWVITRHRFPSAFFVNGAHYACRLHAAPLTRSAPSSHVCPLQAARIARLSLNDRKRLTDGL